MSNNACLPQNTCLRPDDLCYTVPPVKHVPRFLNPKHTLTSYVTELLHACTIWGGSDWPLIYLLLRLT